MGVFLLGFCRDLFLGVGIFTARAVSRGGAVQSNNGIEEGCNDCSPLQVRLWECQGL